MLADRYRIRASLDQVTRKTTQVRVSREQTHDTQRCHLCAAPKSFAESNAQSDRPIEADCSTEVVKFSV